jgi:hypothetical protein
MSLSFRELAEKVFYEQAPPPPPRPGAAPPDPLAAPAPGVDPLAATPGTADPLAGGMGAPPPGGPPGLGGPIGGGLPPGPGGAMMPGQPLPKYRVKTQAGIWDKFSDLLSKLQQDKPKKISQPPQAEPFKPKSLRS